MQDVVWINNPFSNAEPREASIAAAELEDPQSPSTFGTDGGPKRHTIASVHVASKMLKGGEEEQVVVGADAGDEQEGLSEDGNAGHEARSRMGGRLRIPGLGDRRQRVA